LAGTTSLELEIINLHREGRGLDYVCQELYSKIERSDAISSAEINNVVHFLQLAGRFDLIKILFINSLRKSKFGLLPVGLMADIHLKITPGAVSDADIEFFENHIYQLVQDSTAIEETILNSDFLNSISLRAKKSTMDYRANYIEKRKLQKGQLVEQLNKFKIYNLSEQEEQTLQQIIRLFPDDVEVKLIQQAHLEKKADAILNRINSRNSLSKKTFSRLGSPEENKTRDHFSDLLISLADKVKTQSPDQLYNLAILAFQLELFEPALIFINDSPPTAARDWLKAEILLEAERFLDLLKHVEELEKDQLTDSDSVYGATYLKALAYHGLGQTNIGLQLLEQISHVHPNYRSTDALIVEWKNS
jgi:hypothetical protein